MTTIAGELAVCLQKVGAVGRAVLGGCVWPDTPLTPEVVAAGLAEAACLAWAADVAWPAAWLLEFCWLEVLGPGPAAAPDAALWC